MESETRRQKIIELLKKQEEPISGSQLAEQFGVTRQVIVKDMGMIKAGGCQDCRSPERVCRAMVVLWEPMMGMDAEVILIHENLGL